jgi:hypothetical protein
MENEEVELAEAQSAGWRLRMPIPPDISDFASRVV